MSFEKSVGIQPQGKWHEVQLRTVRFIADLFAKLQAAGPMPEGKTHDHPTLRTGKEMMEYAERVLADQTFWASLPEQFDVPYPGTPSRKFTVKSADLKAQLSKFVEDEERRSAKK